MKSYGKRYRVFVRGNPAVHHFEILGEDSIHATYNALRMISDDKARAALDEALYRLGYAMKLACGKPPKWASKY